MRGHYHGFLRSRQDAAVDSGVSRSNRSNRSRLQQILETVNRAPSAGNLQGYEVYLVTNHAVLQALTRSTSGQDFIDAGAAGAGLLRESGALGEESTASAARRCIACKMRPSRARMRSWPSRRWAWRRCGWAPSTMMPCAPLSAWATICARWPFLPIGYAAETPEHRSRRALAELVHRIE